MDPATLAILLGTLKPVLICLAVFGFPVGLIWVVKSHQVKLRELEIESGQLGPNIQQRLDQIDARLSQIEQAMTGQLSSPPASADLMQAPPDAARSRLR